MKATLVGVVGLFERSEGGQEERRAGEKCCSDDALRGRSGRSRLVPSWEEEQG